MPPQNTPQSDMKNDSNTEEQKIESKTEIQNEIEKQSPMSAGKGEHPGLKGKHILWVEDDKFLGNIVSKRMSEYDCEMFLAKNGDEAFAYLGKQTTPPDIIVLDLVLPGMSGFDILRNIRNDGKFAKIPIIILSNLNQSADIERTKILGAQKFMVKASVSLDEIVKTIESLAATKIS